MTVRSHEVRRARPTRSGLPAVVALIALIELVHPASAESAARRMLRLCNSVDQRDCWIKAGSQLCDDRDGTCRKVDADTPAQITRQAGPRVFVETRARSGSVTARSIGFDRSK